MKSLEKKQESQTAISVQSSKNYLPETVQKTCKSIELPEQAFNSGLPSLASMYKEFGEVKVIAYIKLWITDLVEFINVGKNMLPNQINQTAQMIYDEYHYLNVADINLVFKRAKMGYYGQPYKLDGQVILSWFRDYNNERCLAAVDENVNKAVYSNDIEPVPEDKIELLKKIQERFSR